MDNWNTICSASDLVPNMGICALVAGKQVAVFNCTRTGSLYAVSNYDPIGKANILSRGLIGSIEGKPYVASPLYKQHFNLETGECLEKPMHRIETFAVREQDGQIQVQAAEAVAA
jgi:nitrite reductase (NADH) small subunit